MFSEVYICSVVRDVPADKMLLVTDESEEEEIIAYMKILYIIFQLHSADQEYVETS